MENTHKQSVVQSLAEMGFSEKVIELAYTRSQIKTVEGLINYIDSHPNLENEPADAVHADGEHQAPQEAPGEAISDHVNQAFVQDLVQTGLSKDVAEKALFFTQNASVEAALAWVEQHRGDPDFAEPLFIVKQQGPKLTPEEAKKRAKELQAQIRENRAKKDKEAELEAEILRLKSGKGLTQAQRDLQDLQAKLDMERVRKDREEKEAAKQKIMDEINRDRRDKGLKPTSQVVKQIEDVFPDILKKMHKVYPDAATVKTCLATLNIYLSSPVWPENYVQNPNEEKFRKINLENANFKARVGDIIGGKLLLKEVGFEEHGTFLEMKGHDNKRAAHLVSEIEKALSRMN